MSTSDIWANIDHDWQRPVVLPTLPVAQRGDSPSVRGVTDVVRRDRLAFAIRAAMGKRNAQQIAATMSPSRSKETVARWARGETVPSALDVGPLARALGVRVDFLVDPPELPSYPLSDYLVSDEDAHRQADLVREAAASSLETRVDPGECFWVGHPLDGADARMGHDIRPPVSAQGI